MKFDDLSGYILAGGKSSRMGRDKALIDTGERTFAQNSLDILKEICDSRIKFILNHNQNSDLDKFPKEADFLFDIYRNRGPLGGIHAALNDCKTTYAIILAVDMPNVSDVFLKRMTDLFGTSDLFAVVPRTADGRIQPLCAVYNAGKCLPVIEKTLKTTTNAAVYSFLNVINPVWFEIEDTKFAPVSDELFRNMNLPEDLE
ncbi:MAG: molybdenum cofactor guanylyltransferase [Pyrinomonadaceae bacterium]